MTEPTISVLVERIDNFKELMIEKFENNEREHKEILNKTDNSGKFIDDLQKRMSRLEKWKAWVTGGLTIIGILMPLIFGLLIWIIKKVFE